MPYIVLNLADDILKVASQVQEFFYSTDLQNFKPYILLSFSCYTLLLLARNVNLHTILKLHMVKMLPYLKELSVRELLRVGAHFGHKVSHMHPKMMPYIHSKKSAVHIIDIRKTVKGIIEACYYLVEQSRKGSQFLLVGTKRQLKNAIENLSRSAGINYVSERWPGGLLTNFQTISTSIKKLEKINEMEEAGQLNNLTKKEKAGMAREKRRLMRNLGGILNLKKIPDVMIVVDPGMETIAVREAKKMGLKVIGLIDSDTDPSDLDIVIPCNDDSLNVVYYILRFLCNSIAYGRNGEILKPDDEKVTEVAEAV